MVEAELLERCRNGETAAWEVLFDRHYQATARFIAQLGHNLQPEDVEELCQEVFLSIIKSLRSFHGHSRFQTWLFRVAINKTRDFQQRQKAAKRGGGQIPLPLDNTDPEQGPVLNPPSPGIAPDAALVNAEALQLVGAALGQLSQPWREVLELRYFADLSYEQIAAALGLKPKTVSSRLSKALDRLERVLRARDHFAPSSVRL